MCRLIKFRKYVIALVADIVASHIHLLLQFIAQLTYSAYFELLLFLAVTNADSKLFKLLFSIILAQSDCK